ncbi:DUF3883 domain-containing protein [Streptomonospora sp. PA3]|nr:DUF3883 domain-containing protein [Streptomonospora sp. PA3]
MKLEDLTPETLVTGITPGTAVKVVATMPHGPDAVTLVYSYGDNQLDQTVLTREDEPRLAIAEDTSYSFTADPEEFKLAAEAMRIRMAASFDPMPAINTSSLEPLPHQIQAVYGHMLARHTPLRFLLADDPGAGKTIMAGLYIKELKLRGDLNRCLIVAPGALVEQWQDELLEKFGLSFEILTRERAEAINDGTVFDHCPLLIARMDQVKRPPFIEQLQDASWDLAVVDEAHRMSARMSAGKVERTGRYRLGEVLSTTARHFLLMTATPHAGKEEDFQLFLRLLDRDRFEGGYDAKVHNRADTTGLMRRMVKEDLLTFEGKPLFPERRASTISYELSPPEQDLYEAVTDYVRHEMNQADKLKHAGDTRRGNTVGFALTILQRRLASSPQAILRSLERRRDRLDGRRREMQQALDNANGFGTEFTTDVGDPDDLDDQLPGAELEKLEDEVVDAATAARTIPELDKEIESLHGLVRQARDVFAAKVDRKWQELAALLDSEHIRDPRGEPRKLIVFTEHRDTLNYLVEQIRNRIGQDEAVVSIHGGMARDIRRTTTEVFTQDRRCRVLVATDAAGEGLNLQRANLMVNYDLPWNPNKIEQRFGRIHRIGQSEVCHLWNLVAPDTREGQVFQTLLAKVQQQQKAYEGRVFDVLGEAFQETPLRSLLMQAIRYGEQPEVRSRLEQVIDEQVGEGLAELLEERSAQHDKLADADVAELRRRMDEARARRLQPHYVRQFFLEAFARLRGRISERETGRYEVTRVPARVRDHFRGARPGRRLPERYVRVVFDRDLVRGTAERKPADLLAPGHPLLDAVVDIVTEDYGPLLREGTLLVDDTPAGADPQARPRLLVALLQEITDSADPPRTVSKRFDFVELDADGSGSTAGEARYLDYRAPQDEEYAAALGLAQEPWLQSGVEQLALSWSVQHTLPQHREEIESDVTANVRHVRKLVEERLTGQINHWDTRYLELTTREAEGKPVKESPDYARRTASELEKRLDARLLELDREQRLNTRSPLIAGAVLVVPRSTLDRMLGRPARPDRYADDTRETDERAVAAVLRAERLLGRDPEEMPHSNPGFDIRSRTADDRWVYLEVKGRRTGATAFWVTRTEALKGKNLAADFRLALVEVHPDGPDADRVRYTVDPFKDFNPGDFRLTGMEGDWAVEWARGGDPV